MKTAATLTVNGAAYPVELDPHLSLLDAVRDLIGLTGSKEGCDDSECGACMMLLDGKPVNSCSYLALQADGRDVTTVEGYWVTPALMGRVAEVNRIALFAGILFWSWLWGIPGMLLAIPMMVIVKVICDRVEELQPIGRMLGE